MCVPVMPRFRHDQKPSSAFTLQPNSLTYSAAKAEALVRRQFVGVDRGAGKNLPAHFRPKGGALHVRNNPRHQLAAALIHSEHESLVVEVAATAEDLGVSADQRLVDLDNLTGAAEGIVAVEAGHVLPDLMAHAPRGLVGDAQFPLDTLGGNAV